MSKGQVLNTEHQLEQLLQLGACVDAIEIKAAADRVLLSRAQKADVPLSLQLLWDRTPEILQILLTWPERKTDFPGQVELLAAHILELHDHHVEFSIYRAVRQEKYQASSYGYAHSVHTAMLCILLSRHLGWPKERIMSLIKAALTMNMSIVKLQGQMAAQTTPLSASQRTEIFAHPEQGLALLKQLGVTDQDWLSAIAQHHEHLNGTGYPAGCCEINDMATVLHATDVLMAKISPRVLRRALSIQEAIRQLYLEDNGGIVSTALIKTFGIYPPGEFVKLASGELGVVVERTANAKAPIVATITDTAGRPATRTLRHDTGQARFAITGVVADKAMLNRLMPERLYGFAISNPLRLPFDGFLMG